MKCFSIKTPIYVIPVHNYCLVNIAVSLSAYFYNGKIAFVN